MEKKERNEKREKENNEDEKRWEGKRKKKTVRKYFFKVIERGKTEQRNTKGN